MVRSKDHGVRQTHYFQFRERRIGIIRVFSIAEHLPKPHYTFWAVFFASLLAFSIYSIVLIYVPYFRQYTFDKSSAYYSLLPSITTVCGFQVLLSSLILYYFLTSRLCPQNKHIFRFNSFLIAVGLFLFLGVVVSFGYFLVTSLVVSYKWFPQMPQSSPLLFSIFCSWFIIVAITYLVLMWVVAFIIHTFIAEKMKLKKSLADVMNPVKATNEHLIKGLDAEGHELYVNKQSTSASAAQQTDKKEHKMVKRGKAKENKKKTGLFKEERGERDEINEFSGEEASHVRASLLQKKNNNEQVLGVTALPITIATTAHAIEDNGITNDGTKRYDQRFREFSNTSPQRIMDSILESSTNSNEGIDNNIDDSNKENLLIPTNNNAYKFQSNIANGVNNCGISVSNDSSSTFVLEQTFSRFIMCLGDTSLSTSETAMLNYLSSRVEAVFCRNVNDYNLQNLMRTILTEKRKEINIDTNGWKALSNTQQQLLLRVVDIRIEQLINLVNQRRNTKVKDSLLSQLMLDDISQLEKEYDSVEDDLISHSPLFYNCDHPSDLTSSAQLSDNSIDDISPCSNNIINMTTDDNNNILINDAAINFTGLTESNYNCCNSNTAFHSEKGSENDSFIGNTGDECSVKPDANATITAFLNTLKRKELLRKLLDSYYYRYFFNFKSDLQGYNKRRAMLIKNSDREAI